MYKYRSSIRRATKKRKPPGRKRKAPTSVNASEDEAIITTEAEVPQSTSNITESTCSKKLKLTHQHLPEPEKSSLWFYLLFDRVLNDIIDIGSCPECSSKVSVVHDLSSKKGLAHV